MLYDVVTSTGGNVVTGVSLNDATGKHFLVSGYLANDNELIPFEGNEDKLGKNVK